MNRTWPGTGLQAATLLLMLAWLPASDAQTFERGPTHSPHGPLAIPCSSCHTQKSWQTLRAVPEFNHDTQTGYPLRGMHEGVKCSLCHTKLVFNETSTRCADCHADIHRRQFGADCAQCHCVKGWTVAVRNIRDHLNRFPLLGAHVMVECDACHTGAATGQFIGLSTACQSCHMRDFNRTTEPAHAAAGFSTACETCHGMDTFLAAKFDHASIGFPLVGAHATLPCESCHAGNRFKGTPATCIGCHNRDFIGAKDPDHIQSGFSTDCAACHTTVSWAGAKFDHSATSFPLTGAHASLACSACHANNVFVGLSTACVSCHLKDEQGTTNPNHVAAGFPQDCSLCHTTVNWSGAAFNHTTQTKFPLTGAHVNAACNLCHVNNLFAGLPMTCVSCHLADFQKTTNPNHVTGNFSQDCQFCHNTASWDGAVFDHSKTAFPLTGAHLNVACATCHVNNVYAGLSTACISCHLKDEQATTDPNHVAAGFPQDCSICHTTVNWSGATFNHSTQTKFPLTGAHLNVACATCHVNNVFAGLSTACISCHLKDWQGTTDPNHAAAGFPQTCDSCHTTVNWSGAVFNHTTQTKFPLTGAHINVACATCHVNNVFAGLSTACISCHLKDWQGTTDPNHAAAGFPQDCSVCHSTTNWSGAAFDHSKTPFPLTGAHVNVACATCHANNVFAGLPTTCVSCHLKDYNGATNPNHAALGFPQTCDTCHTTAAWQPATFNHSTTAFPLTGAHVSVACSACHVNGNYTTTPTDCYSCHAADYNGTTNPNHVAAGFPRTCATCHTTTAWTGATFNHTWFPTNHGNAKVCADCHTNSADYSVFQCTNCHTATQTNGEHSGVRGYVYNSTNCYQCHPSGRGGG